MYLRKCIDFKPYGFALELLFCDLDTAIQYVRTNYPIDEHITYQIEDTCGHVLAAIQ